MRVHAPMRYTCVGGRASRGRASCSAARARGRDEQDPDAQTRARCWLAIDETRSHVTLTMNNCLITGRCHAACASRYFASKLSQMHKQ